MENRKVGKLPVVLEREKKEKGVRIVCFEFRCFRQIGWVCAVHTYIFRPPWTRTQGIDETYIMKRVMG